MAELQIGRYVSKKRRKPRVKEADDQSSHDGGYFLINRRGRPISHAWNMGRCGLSDRPRSMCKGERSHQFQCDLCLGPHAPI